MLMVETHVSCLHLYNLGSIPSDELTADSIDTWHRSANLTKPKKVSLKKCHYFMDLFRSNLLVQCHFHWAWMACQKKPSDFVFFLWWRCKTNNFSRHWHWSTFQTHGAQEGLGWAGPGARWGGREGMVSTNHLLINTGRSSQWHIKHKNLFPMKATNRWGWGKERAKASKTGKTLCSVQFTI